MNGSELERFGWVIEFLESAERFRPDLPIGVIEEAYDRLVDLLTKRPDMGQTRAAVFALGRKQLGWRISDAMRAVYTSGGEWRATPAAAVSLDSAVGGGGGEGTPLKSLIAIGGDDPVASQVLDRLELQEILDEADLAGGGTGQVVRGAMAGYSTKEIAESTGMKANTVDQRRSRFVRRFLGGEGS